MWICWAQLLPGRNPAWIFLRMGFTSSLILFMSILLYDTTLFKPIVTPSNLVDFQSDIDSIHDWFCLNHLTASASKTKLMIISTKRDPFLPDVALTLNISPLNVCLLQISWHHSFWKKLLGSLCWSYLQKGPYDHWLHPQVLPFCPHQYPPHVIPCPGPSYPWICLYHLASPQHKAD